MLAGRGLLPAVPGRPDLLLGAGPLARYPRRVEDEALRFSHSGERFVLGFGLDFFGIWDRAAPASPMERFPRTDEGWRDAWLRFVSIEHQWAPVARTDGSGGELGEAVSTGALASPLARLGARVIDGLIVAVILTGLVAGGAVHIDMTSVDAIPAALLGVALVVGFLYETTFIALRGQTPGKMLLRVRVVRVEDGRVPGWRRAFIRWVVPILFSIVPFGALVAYLWLLWDRRRQGLHDKAARTLVVRAPAPERGLTP
jgi:uncharacterized RDD family membrane protein YckC